MYTTWLMRRSPLFNDDTIHCTQFTYTYVAKINSFSAQQYKLKNLLYLFIVYIISYSLADLRVNDVEIVSIITLLNDMFTRVHLHMQTKKNNIL